MGINVVQYPILKFPLPIEKIRNGELDILKQPQEPIPPSRPSFPIFALLLCVIVVFCGFHNVFLLILVLMIGGFIPFYLVFSHLTSSEKEYNYEVAKYTLAIKEYDLKLEERRELLEKFKEKSNLRKFALNEIRKFNQENKAEAIKVTKNCVAKGFSETMFKNILSIVFGQSVQQTITAKSGDYQYIPDIVYQDENIVIDIEIDEPYVYKTKEPIHFVSRDQLSHQDDSRDFKFTYSNWMVIRFSEYQIVNNPVGCCKVVAGVIKVVTGETKYSLSIRDFPQISSVDCWTKEDSIEMAKANFRESYLSNFGLFENAKTLEDLVNVYSALDISQVPEKRYIFSNLDFYY